MKPKSQSSGTQTIFWWVVWISLTIGSFFVASAVWTPIIAAYVGPVAESSRAAIFWVTAVFGTWLIFLFPLIIVMYQKVDKAYDDARIRREKNAARFRSIDVPAEKRRLSDSLSKKLIGAPEIIEGGHLISVTLKDGRKIPNVYVSGRNEILGIYDYLEFPFTVGDVVDLENIGAENLSGFLAMNWLRLDGVQAPE